MASRIRVYELAKELGVDSKEVMAALEEMGMAVKNHMASLDDAVVQGLRKRFAKKVAPKRAPSLSPAQPEAKPKVSAAPQAAQVKVVREVRAPATGQGQPRINQAVRPAQPAPREASAKSRTPVQTRTAQMGRQARPAQLTAKTAARQQATSPAKASETVRGAARPQQHLRVPPRAQATRPGQVPGARHVTIQGPVGVRDLASLIGAPVNVILRTLMSTGVLISINQEVPPDIAVKVAQKLGCVVTLKEPELTQEQAIAEELNRPDNEAALVPRPPVVTVMGHVDHGKTSLLDAIRHTNVTAKEAGGITQHIGASVVEHGDNRIIFLDTPGHEAFTAMRARGAKVTDVAVLVVAADDGVMPQTVEAINHARAAGVPIIVALNKIDKPGARIDRVKQQLADNGLVPEDWGGDTVVVPVSAKTGEGIKDLLDMIVLVSEIQEIKTDPTRKGRGYIIESRMDKGKGPVATALIKAGSLRVGDVIITDTTWGRIRTMYDARGRQVKKAGPAMPVELVGLEEVPQAGDVFLVVDDEKTAKEVTERRKLRRRMSEMQATRGASSLKELLAREEEEAANDLKVIVKCDVQGSLEAVLQALGKLEGGEVKPQVIHSGVGGIIESDVTLAKASGARILGFNVRPYGNAAALADANGVEIRTYRVIYDLLDDVSAMLKGLVKPKTEEVVLGRAEVRQTFHVPKVGTVAGCYVNDGKVSRSASVRLIRDGVVIYEGKMASLKRFKDDVSEVSSGYECGIGLDRFQDVKPGDVIEAFAVKEVGQA